MEAFEVLIATQHHATVDAAQPVGLGERDGQTAEEENPVGDICREDELQQADDDDWRKHRRHGDDDLPLVLHLVLARQLLVERQRLLVVDGHLEE